MTLARPLEPGLAVCSFVSPDDLPEVARGFRTIVNNRPDAEEPGQPASGEFEQAARRLGLAYVHLPVAAGQITDAQVAEFARALEDQPGPVLAFCRSGTRSASLWALARAGKQGAAPILAAAAEAGFDLQALAPRLAARAAG
jgi:sulfide:quinone oxidoreductase